MGQPGCEQYSHRIVSMMEILSHSMRRWTNIESKSVVR